MKVDLNFINEIIDRQIKGYELSNKRLEKKLEKVPVNLHHKRILELKHEENFLLDQHELKQRISALEHFRKTLKEFITGVNQL